MTEEYINEIPQWFNEDCKLDLVLSNDIDSLVSCALLKKIKGWDVKYFYDFENSYAAHSLKKERHDRCWVDVAVLNGEKAFDNHVSMVTYWDQSNPNMINPNLVNNITNECYEDKYAGSTALLIWSIYDIPLPPTEEGKMLLLCIDSMFKGHYSEHFSEANTFYLCEMLGMDELLEVMNRHKAKEFYTLTDKYRLNNDLISFKEGKLQTDLDLKKIGELLGLELTLPDDSFSLWRKYKICHEKVEEYIHTASDIARDIFSLSFTYKNSARYSKVV